MIGVQNTKQMDYLTKLTDGHIYWNSDIQEIFFKLTFLILPLHSPSKYITLTQHIHNRHTHRLMNTHHIPGLVNQSSMLLEFNHKV